MGVCNCSMFCCMLLLCPFWYCEHLGKREFVALLNLSSWCLVMVEWLFLAVPLGCLRFVIVVFPDHTHLLFLQCKVYMERWDRSVFEINATCADLGQKMLCSYQVCIR